MDFLRLQSHKTDIGAKLIAPFPTCPKVTLSYVANSTTMTGNGVVALLGPKSQLTAAVAGVLERLVQCITTVASVIVPFTSLPESDFCISNEVSVRASALPRNVVASVADFSTQAVDGSGLQELASADIGDCLEASVNLSSFK
jgi:hypothetical protein